MTLFATNSNIRQWENKSIEFLVREQLQGSRKMSQPSRRVELNEKVAQGDVYPMIILLSLL